MTWSQTSNLIHPMTVEWNGCCQKQNKNFIIYELSSARRQHNVWNQVELLPCSTPRLVVLHGSSMTCFQTSRYCRAKVNLIWSIEFGTAVARRLKQALCVWSQEVKNIFYTLLDSTYLGRQTPLGLCLLGMIIKLFQNWSQKVPLENIKSNGKKF